MQKTEDLIPKIEQLIERDKDDLNGQMSGLRALSACKFEASNLRDKLVNNANEILVSKEKLASQKRIYTQAIVDGLVGLSECSYKPINSGMFVRELAKLIAQRVDQMSFREKIEALSGLLSGTDGLSQEV